MAETLIETRTPNHAALIDEISRQHLILVKEAPFRMAAKAFAFALSDVFIPYWIVLICAGVNFSFELINMGLMRNLDPITQRRRYFWCNCAGFLLQLAFVIPPVLIWQQDGAYVKAFAVGMTCTTMMHQMTVRSIHLPFGIAGLMAVTLAGAAANILYFMANGDFSTFVMSTLCALGTMCYCVGAMIHSNRLHRETAAGRAEALAANAAKTRFLAQMSHELRTPLNAILGMGHAELRRTKDPLSRDHLGVLIEAAEGLSTVLDDILDMSAVQEGRLPIRPIAANPIAEVTANVALFRPSIEEAGLVLHLTLSPDLPPLARFDPKRLRQCLSNLLSNALKHTTVGGISVHVDYQPRLGADPLLRIEVADTGRGIPSADTGVIFNPFVRGLVTPPGPDGRGLGLSISRALARQMGGDLGLVPKEKPLPYHPFGPEWTQGAVFVLTLALPEITVLPPQADQIATPAALAPLQGYCIMTVDDIATNRLVSVSYLTLLGATAIEAAGGSVALNLLAQQHFDLILLDMNMPEMDGLEALRHMRALPGAAGRVPIVALTADATEEHRARYLAHGLDGYLTKPLTPDRLQAELMRLLPRKAAP